MTPPVIAQDLEGLIQEIDEAFAWLESMGIDCKRGRFGEYRRNLITVLEHRKSGKLEELQAFVPTEHYRIAFIESTHLTAIAKAFAHSRGPRFVDRIRSAIAGPAHPLDEKKSGSKPRDLLFELSVAAFFRRRRLPVLLSRDKDLAVKISGSTFLVECKRPQSAKKVRRSMEDASKQLVGHFKRYKAIDRYGVIALDISVVANQQREYLIADSVDAIKQGMGQLVEQFQAQFSSDLMLGRDRRIIATLLFAKALAYHRTENRHVNCERLGICIYARQNSYEMLLANSLYNALVR
jgi:hypothetical protein